MQADPDYSVDVESVPSSPESGSLSLSGSPVALSRRVCSVSGIGFLCIRVRLKCELDTNSSVN